MIAFIVFDHHDLPIYVYSNGEFCQRMRDVAESLESCLAPNATFKSNGGIDPTFLMQLFSPILTSYRVMNHQFHNDYQSVDCEDGTTLGFLRETDFLLLAVARQTIGAGHLVRVCFEIVRHVCGLSFSLLKRSEAHSATVTQLVDVFLELRSSSQSLVTESLHYAQITEEANARLLRVLQDSVERLRVGCDLNPNRVHVLIFKETNIVAIYSGKGASELKIPDILFLNVMSNTLAHLQASTRNSIIVLESYVPYTAHLQRMGDGFSILVLVEAGLRQVAAGLSQIMRDISSSNHSQIEKQLKELQKLARKLNHTLGRQIQMGFESICLDPALLFVPMEHISMIIEDIGKRIPIGGLSGSCQFAPILGLYPGLVHFALIDRKSHRLVGPNLPSVQQVPSLTNLWKMFHTSLEWLNEGLYELLWDDKELCYSHFIWIEDSKDQKLEWKSTWDIQTGILGYPATIGSDFYENLLKLGSEDCKTEPEHYLQMFCIHLGFMTPKAATEQAMQLAKSLKKYLYPTAMLEDLS